MGRRTTDDGLAVVISVTCVLLNVMEHEGAVTKQLAIQNPTMREEGIQAPGAV